VNAHIIYDINVNQVRKGWD